jgi:hypothetical protein
MMKYQVVSEWFSNEPVAVTLKEFIDYVKEEWGYTPKLRESLGVVSVCYYYDPEQHTRVYDGMPDFDAERWYRAGANWETVLVPAHNDE